MPLKLSGICIPAKTGKSSVTYSAGLTLMVTVFGLKKEHRVIDSTKINHESVKSIFLMSVIIKDIMPVID